MSNVAPSAPARVTKAEVSRRTGLTLASVNQLIADGTLKVFEMPVKVRATILKSSLDALVDRLNQQVESPGR